MNRESESRFRNIPFIEKPRSKFVRPQKHLTSFNAGDLIPLYVDEVIPGDTMKVDMGAVVRMLTPIYPVMDDLIMDITAWYIPNRLVWDHWQEFQGENKLTAWEQTVDYEIPQIEAPSGGWAKGTIADYMGIPTGVDNISVNALPFKAYALVWNEFWRDQNLKDAVMITTDDTTLTGSNGTGQNDTYITTGQLGAKPLKVAKTHDYFTSALPDVQKGDRRLIPISSVSGGLIPVITGEAITYTDTQAALSMALVSNNGYPSTPRALAYAHANGGNVFGSGSVSVSSYPEVYPNNLYADLSQGASIGAIGTINDLRQAFAIQRILESFARGGTRYTEILKNIWGVQAPDARLQRPEYLGGQRIPVQISQVLQQSETSTNGTPLGETGAFSNTAFSDFIFQKSFVEHGTLMILGCIRIKNHTYQQGIERMWSRKTRYDFYMPQLAHLGEQAILEKEIYAQGTSDDDDVFGYQERWAEYRYKPNRVSSRMRSNYQTSLDAWHYADEYVAAPSLSSEWIDESTSEINRTLAVGSGTEDQFYGDFFFVNESTRLMPIYSVPGLLDHY